MLLHKGSAQILFAPLPLDPLETLEGNDDGPKNDLFMFGGHEEEILCMVQQGSILLSGDSDGCLKMWSCDDGTLLDSKREEQSSSVYSSAPPTPQITALSFIGPLMAAAGTSLGSITIYDLSNKHKLLAIQVIPPI